MQQQVVRAAHDETGHFAAEKTLQQLSQHYWFPRMRQYVEKYIKCCILCLFAKKPSGKKEGYLHPIPKVDQPFHTIHVDHLGGPMGEKISGEQFLSATLITRLALPSN